MMKNNFYDTSALLVKGAELFADPEERVITCSICLQELEQIKSSASKDTDIKYAARLVSHLLDRNDFDFIIYDERFYKILSKQHIYQTNDTKILACAIKALSMYDNMVFYSNDICLKNLASIYFCEENIQSVVEKEDTYKGYQEIMLNEKDMAYFYQNRNENIYNLNKGEYLILKDADGDVVDRLCWTGSDHRAIKYADLTSQEFRKIKPLKDDIQQQLLVDSFLNNKLTLVKGPAGSGKSILSLAFLFNQLDKGKIDKIIIFCNTVAAKGAAKLGFYPGDRNTKLLDSQIGSMLANKLGGMFMVEKLIQEEKLVLLPFADLRGTDTTGQRAGVYITEAQNLDISLMKLALQRIGEDSICIIDGDPKTQLDLDTYGGSNNGMRRVSEIFRNSDVYGEIELQTIHRSTIGKIADRM